MKINGYPFAEVSLNNVEIKTTKLMETFGLKKARYIILTLGFWVSKVKIYFFSIILILVMEVFTIKVAEVATN